MLGLNGRYAPERRVVDQPLQQEMGPLGSRVRENGIDRFEPFMRFGRVDIIDFWQVSHEEIWLQQPV